MNKQTQIILAKKILSEAGITESEYVISLQGPHIIPTQALSKSGRFTKKVRTELDLIGIKYF